MQEQKKEEIASGEITMPRKRINLTQESIDRVEDYSDRVGVSVHTMVNAMIEYIGEEINPAEIMKYTIETQPDENEEDELDRDLNEIVEGAEKKTMNDMFEEIESLGEEDD